MYVPDISVSGETPVFMGKSGRRCLPEGCLFLTKADIRCAGGMQAIEVFARYGSRRDEYRVVSAPRAH
jgi:hypothetical protein